MQNSYRRPSLFWPIVLIGLGVLLLLQNLNLLPPNVWEALVPLWPVLLIVLGLDMFVGRRSVGGAILVVLLSTLIVVAALTWAALRAQQLPPGETRGLIQTYRGAKEVSVELDFDVGELNVSALTGSDYLMEGEAKNGPGESAEQSYAVEDGEGQLTLSQKRNPLYAPFLSGRDSTSRWDIRLAAKVPVTLKVNTGVGSASLDLSGLNLTALDLTTGVGRTSVIFPASGPLTARVKAGVGDVILTVPADVPTRITVTSGLTQVRIPARFSRDGNVYTTVGFSPSGHYLELEVSAGIGSVTVK
jgi:hypothetical protein